MFRNTGTTDVRQEQRRKRQEEIAKRRKAREEARKLAANRKKRDFTAEETADQDDPLLRPSTGHVASHDGEEVIEYRVSFVPYKEPKDIDDIAECEKLDAINRNIYQHNVKFEPQLSELLALMGVSHNYKVSKPPNYHKAAYDKWRASIHEKNLRNLYAVEYLARQNPPLRLGIEYHSVHDAGDLAEKIEFQRHLKTVSESVRRGNMVNIEPVAGEAHGKSCRCLNMWDGRSPTCSGGTLRLEWRPGADHHFLFPNYRVALASNTE
jgi:hypothetical protein